MTFWDLASSLVINGSSYMLVADIDTLASSISANPSGFFALANDYDTSADGTYSSAPIGTTFAGTFEVLHHRISNLHISTVDQFNVGLFARIASTGTVRDLQLANARMSSVMPQQSGSWVVGGVAGRSDGQIVGVMATGKMHLSFNQWSGDYPDVGGIVGYSTGAVSRSSARMTIDTMVIGGQVGGLVGELDGSFSGIAAIENSSASGSIVTEEGEATGGLVGYTRGASIRNSSASGNIASDHFSGGLAGIFGGGGSIENSYATGNLSPPSYRNRPTGLSKNPCGNAISGGLVGFAGGKIVNSYAARTVTVGLSNCTGGFVGRSYASIQTSYSIGAVSGGENSTIGGFIGSLSKHHQGPIKQGYWDIDTSGTTQGAGNGDDPAIIGLTDAQMKSALPDGFAPAVWGQNPSINNGYPYLLANPPQ